MHYLSLERDMMHHKHTSLNRSDTSDLPVMEEMEPHSPGEIETGVAGRACEACHKKKTKCDMQQPICGLCRRTGKDCHFPSTRKRPSRQEPSVRAKLQKVNGNLDRLVELLESNPSIGEESLKGLLDTRGTSEGSSRGHTSPRNSKPSLRASSSGSPHEHVIQTIHPSRSVASARSMSFPVSYDLAMHLIDVYFDNIQPWLPIFHKPTFIQWAADKLDPEGDCLSSLSPNETVMFVSIFAMSARFSSHSELDDVLPRDRGERFVKVSEYWLKIVRDAEEFDICFLKACILLASYLYTSGQSKRGWYITHLCVRGCYELGLHQIDEEDDMEESNEAWVEKESMRRLFWSIFEVDSFGSIIKRKPFAIDWRHIEVKMPVSDEDWFAGRKVEANRFVRGADCWKTLVGSPNQDGRAWYLLSKASVGHVFDLMLFKDGITAEQKSTAENNISCFKLAMPEHLQLMSPIWSSADLPPAHKNWIIAMSLYLAAASFILTRMPIVGQPPSPIEETSSRDMAAYSSRVIELNEILKRWPVEALPYVHPCLICTILTYDESLINLLPPSVAIAAYRNLSGLILSKVAERWKLASVLLRVRDLAHNYYTSDDATRADLVRQYPVYFDRELKRYRKLNSDETPKRWTPPLNSPDPSVYTRHSIDQSLSPISYAQHLPSQSQPQSQSQLQQQQTQPQQQPTPPFGYITGSPLDNMYDSSMTLSGNNTTTTASTNNNFPNYSSYSSNPGTGTGTGQVQNPEDIDAIFSSFLQEPWWQDFGSVNFVV